MRLSSGATNSSKGIFYENTNRVTQSKMKAQCNLSSKLQQKQTKKRKPEMTVNTNHH